MIIGNGARADGLPSRSFVVPAGATRFYIGVMNGQQWSDNSGSLSATVTRARVSQASSEAWRISPSLRLPQAV